MGVGVARQSSKSTPFLSISVPMSLLPPSVCLFPSSLAELRPSLYTFCGTWLILPLISLLMCQHLRCFIGLDWNEVTISLWNITKLRLLACVNNTNIHQNHSSDGGRRLTRLLKLCWPCNIERFCVVEPDSTLVISWLLSACYSLLMIFVMLCVLVLEQLYS